ncbi:NADH-quinone oxidoreductase subunit G, partial [Geodermatophilus sp. DF01-2]|uniref:molybdopterin dinucleotide binding domain-containing protein n=1 Tax=Geodermatophilus sp. DF01-2 TaxID=2559610 RepID=UPI00110550FB
ICPVGDAGARAQVAAAWGVADLPPTPGRDATGILTALVHGELAGLLVGGVDPADLPDPGLAEAALARAAFVVSLELLPSAVTEHADVVLPVAAAPEKAGAYLDWEGRLRPFDATLHGTGQLPDGRVLQGLADELDVDLRLPAPEVARAELAALGVVAERPRVTGPDVAAPADPELAEDQAVLASWRHLLDVGTLQRDEPELAGTARPPVARIGKDVARRLGLADGDRITVEGSMGHVTLPVLVTEMPDQVVWLPMRSPGSEIRTALGTGPGGVVRLVAPARPTPTAEGTA